MLKISIVTPSYNQAKFIEECLRSVREQNYPAVEHIVVDGASTDGTVEILKRYSETPGCEHLCWISEPDEGQSDALNKGFRVATGDIIGWLNSDDRYRPGCFSQIAEAFEKHRHADVIYGDYTWINERGDLLRIRREIEFSQFILSYHRVLYIPTTATFFQSRIFHNGNFPDVKYGYAMDYEFFLRLAQKGYRFRHFPALLADFRWHAHSKTVSHPEKQFEERDAIAMMYSPTLRGIRSKVFRKVVLSALRAAAAGSRYWEKLRRGYYFEQFGSFIARGCRDNAIDTHLPTKGASKPAPLTLGPHLDTDPESELIKPCRTQVLACPLCGQVQDRFTRYAVVRGWRYVRCPGCGLVFLNPRPTSKELASFYNTSYVYDAERYRKSVDRQTEWLDVLAQFCHRTGRLLEVGCSYGYFLAAARDRGWEVEGIELSERASRFAREQLGLRVHHGILSDAFSNVSYDAIVASHLLEHETEPWQFLSKAWERLATGGILALRVPNLESAVSKLAGPCWQWLSAPEHIYMFSEKSIRALLRATGFHILQVRTARGNARNMWFEILRARMKQFVKKLDADTAGEGEVPGFSRPTVYENRLWYRAVERTVQIGLLPLDWMVSRWLQRRELEAELAVIARKPVSEGNVQVIHPTQADGRSG